MPFAKAKRSSPRSCKLFCGYCWRLLAHASAASALGNFDRKNVATDPRCPPERCCVSALGSVSVIGSLEPHQECDFFAPWTLSYCCTDGPAADCYRWGEDAPGYDISESTVVSAVHCRHLCQAHESCAFWTYLVDVSDLLHLRGRCFLKTKEALDVRMQAHAFVVSGERICVHFAEGISFGHPQKRVGLEIGVPWRTFGSTSAIAAASQIGVSLMPRAGSPQWHLEAANVFAVLGFVVVLGAIGEELMTELRKVAVEVARVMTRLDVDHIGNRGPRRYSYGGASHSMHMMHVKPWPLLLDIPEIMVLLETIFPKGVAASGGGGDFVLGGTDTYQSLHVDIGNGQFHKLERPPAVAVNYVLEELSCNAGPLRVIPGSHREASQPPSLIIEPQEAKDAVLCPLPAGSAIVRDLRTWHGGTPNTLTSTRYLPNAEFVDAELMPHVCGKGGYLDPCSPVLPMQAHSRLSARGKRVSAGIVDTSGVMGEVVLSSGGDDGVGGDMSWLKSDFVDFFGRHAQDAY